MSFPRYPAYKDSGVEWLGEVPEHWQVVTLKGLRSPGSGLVSDGSGIKADEYVEDGFIFSLLRTCKESNIDFENVNFINAASLRGVA